VSLAVFCDVPFGHDQAWLVFQLAHFLRHQTIAVTLGSQITASRLDQIRPNDIGWMQDHAQTHLDICQALGITANPLLGETDLTQPGQYEAWMAMHRDEHELFDLALKL
jgi:hypothetical protein